ncbi:MAG TPA: hypothetical protein VKB18_02805 [Gemmatimonadota bacterium]|nr:hypothetical protein [Gemmatimonadota bacterium]
MDDVTEERGPAPKGRLRLVAVERDELSGSRIRLRVCLEGPRGDHATEAEGLDTPIMELRLAAEATLAAAGGALGDDSWLELVGVKLLHAFDSDVILIAVHTEDHPDRKLVGAVPSDPNGRTEAAVKATLDAVNRVLEPHLSGERGEAGAEDGAPVSGDQGRGPERAVEPGPNGGGVDPEAGTG